MKLLKSIGITLCFWSVLSGLVALVAFGPTLVVWLIIIILVMLVSVGIVYECLD